ncbi:HlyD family type I secretion periplasmic adaptor subunit [Anianabacter salinae]|uniref:HlyD family type I secretion periplasmic adaptor subunit n=1 Tax=Anianabacter salinae TaxID=2851023 RepID=UPI00225E5C02|nr:HlyD family type I secretion periplasmic adaptor subunit [Anianabacter salinae]MBV0911769.1 HlyD family type I secretion periplasmic adaptor subunit [Anianabacter salinae]
MFGRGPEAEFLNDIAAAEAGTAGRGAWAFLLLIVGGLAAFGWWAATYEIEELTRGMGRVIPSSQVQIVQAPEGGVVRAIAVAEGDTVAQGDVLITVDDTTVLAEQGEFLERRAALEAERIRLSAEAEEADAPDFPAALRAQVPRAVAAEAEVFASRRRQLAQEIEVLENRLDQRRADLQELQATRARAEAVLGPLRDEITLTEDMATRGVVPEIELLRLRARLAELTGDLAVTDAALPRTRAAISEAENEITAARSGYVLAARERLARLELELAVVQEALSAATERVTRTEIRAPVDGVVNRLAISTLGAVVQAGSQLAEIVPADDGLLIEADLRPQDVAFIGPGEPASVTITAYDPLIYGKLSGEVLRIGANSIDTGEGETFFRVVVRTDRQTLGTEASPLPIIAGMVATVEIQTGRRTVLSYLAKPILRARAEAFRER